MLSSLYFYFNIGVWEIQEVITWISNFHICYRNLEAIYRTQFYSSYQNIVF